MLLSKSCFIFFALCFSGFLTYYKNSCTAAALFQADNSYVSNLTVSDCICTYTACISFTSPSLLTGISMSKLLASPSGGLDSYAMEIDGSHDSSAIAVLINTSLTDVNGFDVAIAFNTNLIVNGSFTYENVTINNATTPIFVALGNSISLNIVSDLPSQFSLADIYDISSSSICTITYMGFSFELNAVIGFNTPNTFSLVWVIAVCVIIIVATLIVSFILFYRTKSTYSAIN